MILDHLTNARTYDCLGGRFKRGFEYLESFQNETLDGKYEIEGSDVFALVQTFTTQEASERVFEAHLAYADIHYIVSGSEWICYSQTSLLQPKAPYDAEREVTFFEDKDGFGFYLGAGYFSVLWPQDAHKPGCISNGAGPQPVRKVVIKVRL